MKTYKAWAIYVGDNEFLTLGSGHVELFVTRQEARQELAGMRESCSRHGAPMMEGWRVARVDVEIREIF